MVLASFLTHPICPSPQHVFPPTLRPPSDAWLSFADFSAAIIAVWRPESAHILHPSLPKLIVDFPNVSISLVTSAPPFVPSFASSVLLPLVCTSVHPSLSSNLLSTLAYFLTFRQYIAINHHLQRASSGIEQHILWRSQRSLQSPMSFMHELPGHFCYRLFI
jgi:hypothetical protein